MTRSDFVINRAGSTFVASIEKKIAKKTEKKKIENIAKKTEKKKVENIAKKTEKKKIGRKNNLNLGGNHLCCGYSTQYTRTLHENTINKHLGRGGRVRYFAALLKGTEEY